MHSNYTVFGILTNTLADKVEVYLDKMRNLLTKCLNIHNVHHSFFDDKLFVSGW